MNIGKAAAASGVSAKMIRHYEAYGLIKADRRGNNYRSYDERHVAELTFIRHGRELSFSLAEIKQLLRLWQRDTTASDARGPALSYVHAIEEKGEAITALLGALKQLLHDIEEQDLGSQAQRRHELSQGRQH